MNEKPKLRPAPPVTTGEHPTLVEIPAFVSEPDWKELALKLEKEVEELEEDVARLRSGQDTAVTQASEYERMRLRAVVAKEPEYPTAWDAATLSRYKALIESGQADVQTFARAAVAETKRSLLEKLK